MPAINIEDLSEKDKLKMEVEQLRKEVKLERQPVSGHGEGARSCPAEPGAGRGAARACPGGAGARAAARGTSGGGAGAAGLREPLFRTAPAVLGRPRFAPTGPAATLGRGPGTALSAPLTLRRSTGPSRGSPWSPGEGAHRLGKSAPRGWHGPARRGCSRWIWHPLTSPPHEAGTRQPCQAREEHVALRSPLLWAERTGTCWC